jgi:hypothetical protein
MAEGKIYDNIPLHSADIPSRHDEIPGRAAIGEGWEVGGAVPVHRTQARQDARFERSPRSEAMSLTSLAVQRPEEPPPLRDVPAGSREEAEAGP